MQFSNFPENEVHKLVCIGYVCLSLAADVISCKGCTHLFAITVRRLVNQQGLAGYDDFDESHRLCEADKFFMRQGGPARVMAVGP